MKHIEFARLIDSFEGRLPADEANSISSHVADCRSCKSEYLKLQEFFGYVSLKPTEEVPQATTANILNIYKRRPAVERPSMSILSKLGVLVFDDWATALNERYAGMDSRQLLYQADGFDIDLRIELFGDRCRVAGQVFPDCVGAVVTLSNGDISATVALNETGEFAFDAIDSGDYILRIQNSEIDIKIDNIPLHL